MAQKTNSRIPMIASKTFMKDGITALNINSANGNPSGLKNNINTKLLPVNRAPHLRRSKSVTDFRSLSTRPDSVFKKLPNATTRKPIKRPALAVTNSVLNKISKVVPKPEPAKPTSKPVPAKSTSKPIQQKIPPYDYKARFNQLKEIHDKLKTQYRDLKIEHETTADQNEDLLARTNDYENLKTAHTILVNDHASAAELIKNLQAKNEKLEYDLNKTTLLLDSTTKELKEITEIHHIAAEKLLSVQEQLTENLELNAIMKENLITLQTEKRYMHNEIQELKGNIRVFCRIRPSLSEEKDKSLYDVNYIDDVSIELFKTKEKKMEFTFDKVFGPTSTQMDIFEELSQLVQSALDGYNVCVFAYGQTGSGKTYTMEGRNDEANRGMIPRSIDSIFNSLESLKRLGWTYKVTASFLEIYNENINDLLDPSKTNLEIRMRDAKGTDVYVSDLTTEDIHSASQLISLMKIAQKNRAVAANESNERSSRSHSVTKISLEGYNEEQGQKCIGNLNLIDLAGSEKFYTNETVRLRETTNINKSLSNLSSVILNLVQKSSHVPYRNSKLTHLLMPSLGGNCKTLMLANISPLNDCYNESINSLRFASTVNQCRTGSIKKQKTQLQRSNSIVH